MIPTMSGRPRIVTMYGRGIGIEVIYDREELGGERNNTSKPGVEKQSKSGETLVVFGDWTKREYMRRQLGRCYDL